MQLMLCNQWSAFRKCIDLQFILWVFLRILKVLENKVTNKILKYSSFEMICIVLLLLIASSGINQSQLAWLNHMWSNKL